MTFFQDSSDPLVTLTIKLPEVGRSKVRVLMSA